MSTNSTPERHVPSPAPDPALVQHYLRWRRTRDMLNEREGSGDYPHRDEWAGSDDDAVTLLERTMGPAVNAYASGRGSAVTDALERELDRWVALEQEIDRSDMTRPRTHSFRRDKVTRHDLGHLTGHIEGLAKALRIVETGDTHGWEQHRYASLARLNGRPDR